ncbi:Tkl protein kinase, partial [Globisporangium splendens]
MSANTTQPTQAVAAAESRRTLAVEVVEFANLLVAGADKKSPEDRRLQENGEPNSQAGGSQSHSQPFEPPSDFDPNNLPPLPPPGRDPPGPPPNEPPMSIGGIVGITLASVFTVLALLGIIVLYYRRRNRRELSAATASRKDLEMTSDTTPYSMDPFVGSFASGARMNRGTRSNNSTTLSSNGTSHSLYRDKSGGMWEDDEIVALRIPFDKVVRSALISRGGYGEVYSGSYRDQRVAIKSLLPEMRKNLRQINSFLAETKLMASMEHPRIVRFIGVAWDSLTDLCVVSEFMEGGDLRALLTRFETQEHRPHGFDADKVKIAFHVAHALTYLHSLLPVVLHRDLKSKNILLDSYLDAKITDFGVSRESSDRTMTAGVGTSLWMAPEVMMGERYDEKADIFSFGVVLSELDSHMLPYAEAKETNSGRVLPDTALLQMVSLGRLKVELSANAPQSMVDLANACVALDPSDRPTAVDVTYKLQLALRMYEDFVF